MGIISEKKRNRLLRDPKARPHSVLSDVGSGWGIGKALAFFGCAPRLSRRTATLGFPMRPASKVGGFSALGRDGRNTLEGFCAGKGVGRKSIRPRAPERNEEAERSHWIDQEKSCRRMSLRSLSSRCKMPTR